MKKSLLALHTNRIKDRFNRYEKARIALEEAEAQLDKAHKDFTDEFGISYPQMIMGEDWNLLQKHLKKNKKSCACKVCHA